ncbi:MAG: hypothetical protein JO215_03660, partial [Ktedonobacteraceae bacterium]|nr:hypothetical protein [Ktedonobacteraceae bacterium]
MSELPLVQHRIQTLRRYMSALECGDADTIAAVLEDAGQDRGLERMILEVNAVYQHEDSTIVRAADAAAAQQKLLKLADQTIGREEMQNYSLHNEENPAHAALHTTQADASNNTNSPTAKKLQGRKFATPVFPAKMVASQKWYSSRKGWIAASAAAVLIAILLIPGTSALANQFLSLFTVKNFQPVQV